MRGRIAISLAVAGGVLVLAARKSPAQSIQTVNRLFTGRFDPVFRRHCPGIPVPYLRALAKHESDFDPSEASGPAHGLLQVTEKVRLGFNERFGTAHSRADLLSPSVNAEIACDLIARIARVLPKNHPVALPRVAWLDPRFVGIVTLAWNAGFSEASGMGFVLGKMERAGLKPSQITIDSVHDFALGIPNPKARFLKIPGRLEFARRVTDDYMAQISQS